MSPEIKPTSPRPKYPPKHSIGRMNSSGLGSPIKPMNELSNTYGETSIYSTNYSKKTTVDSMEKSKTASRCLIRPRDLPGYRTGSRHYWYFYYSKYYPSSLLSYYWRGNEPTERMFVRSVKNKRRFVPTQPFEVYVVKLLHILLLDTFVLPQVGLRHMFSCIDNVI